MIEASSESLGAFLKTQGSQAVAGAVVEKSASETITQGVVNSTDSLEKLTNLLDKINGLLNSPLISNMMSKGIERKSGGNPQDAEVVEVPEGYNPPNQNVTPQSTPAIQRQPPAQIDKKVISETLIKMLVISVEEMTKQDENRTIKQINDELQQEQVQIKLKEQIEVVI